MASFLVAGLGNPGPQYENTRHNIGFHFIDYLANQAGCFSFQHKFASLSAKISLFQNEIILLKPLSYMNLSGGPVLEALQFFKLPTEQLIVIADDLDQSFGAVRMRVGGGHGGHNGIRDIINKLPSDKFARIKIGIDKPAYKSSTAAWVTSPFSTEERDHLLNNSFLKAEERLRDYITRLPKN